MGRETHSTKLVLFVVKGRLDRSHIPRSLNEKPKLQDVLSVRMKNATTGPGENNLYAAVPESKINLAQAGKIAASWFRAVCGLPLSWKSTVLDASAHI